MNESIFLWFNSWAGQGDLFDALAVFTARDLIFLLIISYLGFVFKQPSRNRPRLVVATVLCAVISLQIVILINGVYPTPRPQATDLPVNVLIEYANNQSFPSQHTMFSFFLASLVFFYPALAKNRQKILGLAYLAGATIIGLSRIVVGVHFPADILAGALLGVGIGYLGTLLLD